MLLGCFNFFLRLNFRYFDFEKDYWSSLYFMLTHYVLTPASRCSSSSFTTEIFVIGCFRFAWKWKYIRRCSCPKLRCFSTMLIALKSIEDTRNVTRRAIAVGWFPFCRQRRRVANKICIRLLIAWRRIMQPWKIDFRRDKAVKLHTDKYMYT